jgi:hypothetical protein
MLPAGLPSYLGYRPNTTETFTVQASGISKEYTVTVIWAKLIDHPDEMRTDLAEDYYLKPGPPIDVYAWSPIGPGGFSGSLRGNGRTIVIHSFLLPLPPNNGHHGLFGVLENALIEDVHVHLNGIVTVNAKYAGAIAGEASGSLIQRVRVSGGLGVNITNVTGTSIDAGGIVGHLSNESLIYNSVSTVNVSANVYSAFGGAPYIGGINGAIFSDGGNIVNCYATGTIDGTGHANTRAGGINAGGYSAGTLQIRFCVARNDSIKAGPSGNANYVSAQWGDSLIYLLSLVNYRARGIPLTGTQNTWNYTI